MAPADMLSPENSIALPAYMAGKFPAQDAAVTVRIEEINTASTDADNAQWLVHGISHCTTEGLFSQKTISKKSCPKPCKRSKTSEEISRQSPIQVPMVPRRYSAFESRNRTRNTDACVRNNPLDMRLPSFKALGISSSEPTYMKSPSSHPAEVRMEDDGKQSQHGSSGSGWVQSNVSSSCGSAPLPTPPDEVEIKLEAPVDMGSVPIINVSSTSPDDTIDTNTGNQSLSRSQTRPSSISLPSSTQATRTMPAHGGATYLANLLVSSLGNVNSPDHIQVVSQCLPPQTQPDSAGAVLDDFLEMLASRTQNPPYVTVTLAVNETTTTQDIPTSPPATPSSTHTSTDYFSDQTVFMHAAKVPTYQHQSQSLQSIARPTGVIAAPSSINLSLLERYIPPATGEEVQDFFGTSGRSYLADRLSELSVNDGSLLLVYPTKEGGRTFGKRYVAPIIDPFLRQWVLVNNLTMDAASRLGRMAAIDQMLTYEEMKQRVEAMCQSMSQRASPRGLRGVYRIHHAEIGQVELERSVWVNWFVEQEHARMRDNLVQYHKAGGRMPEPRGHAKVEVTTGMLAREVVAGIKDSTVSSGHASIELGVFVIRRSVMEQ